MEVFLSLQQNPDDALKKYCHKRPAYDLYGGSTVTYFFQMPETLNSVNTRVLRALDVDANEGHATVNANDDVITHSFDDDSKLCGGMKRIFHSNFWINQKRQHPEPGTVITYDDVITFKWMPVNRHLIDYCRYATLQLAKKNKSVKITNQRRRILMILHPQNDFCDRVPGLYHEDEIVVDGIESVAQSLAICENRTAYFRADKTRKRPGTVKSVLTKGNAYYLEVLWDADEHDPCELLVENQKAAESKWRHIRRLDNAAHSNLRVCLRSDERMTKRYGRISSISSQGRIRVSWDVSVPRVHRITELELVESDDTQEEAVFTGETSCICVNSKVRYRRNVTEAATASNPDVPLYAIGEVVPSVDLAPGFVEVVWNHENTCGNLACMGSYHDMFNVYKLIEKNWEKYDEIIVSRDCHQPDHISHKSFWLKHDEDKTVSVPDNFSDIHYMDVLTGRYLPVLPAFTV
jgi:hypothetical protein